MPFSFPAILGNYRILFSSSMPKLIAEQILLNQMYQSLREVENSSFFSKFIDQIQTPEVLNSVFKATIDAPYGFRIPMVIYGIGSIELTNCARFQLALAILMKKRFPWIGHIEVFDPIINEMESRVMETLGCSVIRVNEGCRREVTKPTLFYMPHCHLKLYNNLLEANWTEEKLKNVILLGNEFEGYEKLSKTSELWKKSKMKVGEHILFARNFSKEFKVHVDDEAFNDYYFEAFVNLCWHSYDINYAKTRPHLISINNKGIQWPSSK